MRDCYTCIYLRPSKDMCKLGLSGSLLDDWGWKKELMSKLPECPLHQYSRREQEYQDRQEHIKSLTLGE